MVALSDAAEAAAASKRNNSEIIVVALVVVLVVSTDWAFSLSTVYGKHGPATACGCYKLKLRAFKLRAF